MGSRYGSARERALRGLWILLAAGCMAPRFLQDGQMLRHPAGEFAVPDLSDAGWERVGVENADLAFRHPREGTIAVRARCGLSDPLSLEWRSRELYVGVDAERLSQRQAGVGVPGRLMILLLHQLPRAGQFLGPGFHIHVPQAESLYIRYSVDFAPFSSQVADPDRDIAQLARAQPLQDNLERCHFATGRSDADSFIA